MKSAISLAVLALTAVLLQGGALAGRGSYGVEDGSSSCDDNGPRSVGPLLSKDVCRCTSRSSSVNYCTGRTGQLSIGCSNSNTYLQCVNSACSIQYCPTGLLWDAASSSCKPCAAGLHVDARNRRCVCNYGTTWNSTTLQCVGCPTGATILQDACGCPRSLVLNRNLNACVACPATARYSENTCKCTNTTLFYNAGTGACEACPGSWVTPSPFKRAVCQCSGAPYIFDRKTVSCFLCPAGTTAFTGKSDSCKCNIYGAEFNRVTGCTCPIGKTVNTVTGVCEYVVAVQPSVPAATTTVGTNPPAVPTSRSQP